MGFRNKKKERVIQARILESEEDGMFYTDINDYGDGTDEHFFLEDQFESLEEAKRCLIEDGFVEEGEYYTLKVERLK